MELNQGPDLMGSDRWEKVQRGKQDQAGRVLNSDAQVAVERFASDLIAQHEPDERFKNKNQSEGVPLV